MPAMSAARSDLRDARIVPWSSWREWSLLRASLAAGDLSVCEAYLRVYRLRRLPGLPVALQAGVTLPSQLAAFDGSYCARLGMAMMLTRVVNGLTDRLQPTGAGASARSVRALAEELALPTQLVALRHTACHNALPGADALEDGAKAAVEWLEERYWKPQAKAAEGRGRLTGVRDVFEGAVDERMEGDDGVPDKGEATLARMHRLLGESERKKAKLAAARVRPASGGGKKRRWVECGNEELWKNMPLGLCPWQTEVCTELTGFDEGGRADCADVESNEQEKEGNTVDVCSEPKRVKMRKLREDERRHVEQFRSLLRADIAGVSQ